MENKTQQHRENSTIKRHGSPTRGGSGVITKGNGSPNQVLKWEKGNYMFRWDIVDLPQDSKETSP